jgi:hypothetical protein
MLKNLVSAVAKHKAIFYFIIVDNLTQIFYLSCLHVVLIFFRYMRCKISYIKKDAEVIFQKNKIDQLICHNYYSCHYT